MAAALLPPIPDGGSLISHGMAHLTNIGIGGVNLGLWCREECQLNEPDSAYREFLGSTAGGPVAIDMRVSIELGNMPSMSGLRKIFESGEGWSMFRGTGENFAVLHPSERKNPIWCARLVDGSNDVVIYCGEALVTRNDAGIALANPVTYPLDLILIMYFLSARKGAVLHAAAVDCNGVGLLFPGKSGAGKSTLLRHIGAEPDFKMLSDDRIVVRELDSGFAAFGTPWLGDAGICANRSVPLGGIFFVGRGETSSARRIGRGEALERLLPVTSIPWFDEEVIPEMLCLCERLVTGIPCYEFRFRPDDKAADVVKEFAGKLTST